jgi:hypothetical protein
VDIAQLQQLEETQQRLQVLIGGCARAGGKVMPRAQIGMRGRGER